MMDNVDLLRQILANIRNPERNDRHPWVKSRVVQSYIENHPSLTTRNPGYVLLLALVSLYRQLLPSTPPKIGKRLDSTWGQYGILASLYFAPFVYGVVYPGSLRDAAGRIDSSICNFVFNKTDPKITEEERQRYEIVGDEAEVIPISTLSDWHSKGLIKLADAFEDYNAYLADRELTTTNKNEAGLSRVPDERQSPKIDTTLIRKSSASPAQMKLRKTGKILILLVILCLVIFMGFKVEKIYSAGQEVMGDLNLLKSLLKVTTEKTELLNSFPETTALITKTRMDLDILRTEIEPFLWAKGLLKWVPVYGGDIAQIDTLLSFADKLLQSADASIQAVSPILDELVSSDHVTSIPQFTLQIVGAQPLLTIAKGSLDEALLDYKSLNKQDLSPKMQGYLIAVAPLLKTMQNGLTAAIAFPGLLGADNTGPKTYLVLIQNEDELRATGGFITGVATMVIENGKILSHTIEDSPAIDNPDQYFPPAPWQLEQYMAAAHWVFRDANWYPDFPTTVKWVEMFIATGRSYTFDGVITVNQKAIIYLINGLKSVNVSDVSYPITPENVVSYLRTAKYSESIGNPLNRKEFLNVLAEAILNRLNSGKEIDWITFGKEVVKALDERHILIQVDNPEIQTLLTERQWDGSVSRKGADYILVVDSNIGFNKVNAVINESMTYRVDLTNTSDIKTSLSIIHENFATGNPNCDIREYFDRPRGGGYDAILNRCYLDYLRIYRSNVAQLVDANPHTVPAEMIPWGIEIPARIDTLYDESYEGVNAYGTLLYLPAGQTLETHFDFSLPADVLAYSGDEISYNLYIQKQSGTNATPIVIEIRLPINAEIIESSIPGIMQDNVWRISSTLQKDLHVLLKYRLH